MKSFISTVCLTLVILQGSHGRPQIMSESSSDDDMGKDTLPEDSYFPRDAAGNVVMPDPSRARFAGSEGFQISTNEDDLAKVFSFRPEDDLPVVLMAPAPPAQARLEGEINEPSYGDSVPGVWVDDGSQNYQNQPEQTSDDMSQPDTSGADIPSGKPIGIESYNDQPNMEYQNQIQQQNTYPGVNTRGTLLGSNLRAINEILNSNSDRKARSSGVENYKSNAGDIEGVGIYKSMVFFNHVPKELLNFN